MEFNKMWSDVVASNQGLQELFFKMLEMANQPGFVPPLSVPVTMEQPSPVTQPLVMPHQPFPVVQGTPKQDIVSDANLPPRLEPIGNIKSRIQAVKPCETCAFAPQCTVKGQHFVIQECGPELHSMVQAARFDGEIEVEVLKGNGVPYPVYRDGVFIGVVPMKKEISKVLTALEDYKGKRVKVRTTWLSEKVQKHPSIYTNCEFGIIGEVETVQEVSSTLPEVTPQVDLSEQPEGASFDLGELDGLPV